MSSSYSCEFVQLYIVDALDSRTWYRCNPVHAGNLCKRDRVSNRSLRQVMWFTDSLSFHPQLRVCHHMESRGKPSGRCNEMEIANAGESYTTSDLDSDMIYHRVFSCTS